MKQDNSKITIDQIAKICNVSKTTISRFLNGKYEYMSRETKSHIANVIKEFNYRPNNIARSLKANKSKLIGVVIADISNPFSSILIKGIVDVCKENDYMVIISDTDNDPSKEKEYIQSLIDDRVEGLIINTTGKINDFINEKGKLGIPIVLADREYTELDFDTVSTNNYEMTFNTIKHLINKGFKKIAFFTQDVDGISPRYIRKKAFLDAFRELLNIDARDMVYVININDKEMIEASISDFANRNKDQHKAIFTVNGVTLLNVLNGILNLKLKIPEDMGVCGYDNWGWSSLIPPGITVINQPSYNVGVESAKCLLSRINDTGNKPVQVIELPAVLEEKGSTEIK